MEDSFIIQNPAYPQLELDFSPLSGKSYEETIIERLRDILNNHEVKDDLLERIKAECFSRTTDPRVRSNLEYIFQNL